MTSPSGTRSFARSPSLVLRAALLLALVSLASTSGAQVQRQPAGAPAAPAPSSLIVTLSDNPNWSALTPAQKAALAPLQREWSQIEPSRRAKWLEIANRFPSLAPAEQQRIRARMAEWASLTPAERGRARQQFQESRQIPAPDRQAQWDAYRALPEQTKKELAQRSRPVAAKTGSAGDPKSSSSGSVAKRNDTPTPRLAPARPVTPTVVQAKPGATTTLLSRPAAPPLHQQPGLPKIAATPGFVNPSTLLPNRGPQGAAVRSAAASGPASQP